MSSPIYGTVAIAGRPNVGKSAIFNRLVGRMISIVHDQPGVTRDRITSVCAEGEKPFNLIDTGGIGSIVEDGFSEAIHTEANLALEVADITLFVVDGQTGLTPVDQEIARMLRRSKGKILLVVNKADHAKHDAFGEDFARLGFKDQFLVSAAHSKGFNALLDRIDQLLPNEPVQLAGSDKKPPGIAIVGRPNVGKSSLVNAILEDSRTIVSNVAGTTRDAVDIPYEHGGEAFTLIDTAGIRHRSKHDTSVEVFSVMRSEKSIRRADLCVLVIDASTGVTSQDKQIGGLIQEAEKPCIIVLNKWDLVKPDNASDVKEARARRVEEIHRDLFFLSYAPVLPMSAMTGENVGRLFRTIDRVAKESKKPLGTGALNRVLHKATAAHIAPAKGMSRLNILYATQTPPSRPSPIPAPTFLLFVNSPSLLTEDYRRYLENQIRQEAPYPGLPLVLHLRARKKRGAPAAKGKSDAPREKKKKAEQKNEKH